MNYYYYKTESFPKCKDCGCQMDYWDLRQDQNSYQCVPCTANMISDKLIETVRKMLNNGQSVQVCDANTLNSHSKADNINNH